MTVELNDWQYKRNKEAEAGVVSCLVSTCQHRYEGIYAICNLNLCQWLKLEVDGNTVAIAFHFS